MIVKELKWDSDFFHRNISKIVLEPCDTILQWEQAIASSRSDLIYLFFADDLTIKQKDFLQTLKPAVSVTNVTYKKIPVKKNEPVDPAIQIVSTPNDFLYSMVLDCGKFSRFYFDPVLKKDYSRLYTQWLNNTFTNNDWHCITFMGDKVPAGICVFSNDSENAGHIELLAVSKDFQKRNIGQRLLHAAEDILLGTYNIEMLYVTTQQNNIPACRCYEKFGFIPNQKTHICHIWRIE